MVINLYLFKKHTQYDVFFKKKEFYIVYNLVIYFFLVYFAKIQCLSLQEIH